MAQDPLDELYAQPPGGFTKKRTELAALAKRDGDSQAAARIAAARKPTKANRRLERFSES